MNIHQQLAVVDRVTTHLLAQNEKSMQEGNICLYRGEKGRKCAIGCLIADEHYNPGFESLDARSALVQLALSKSGVVVDGPEDERLLLYLQAVHDNTAVASWPYALKHARKWVEFGEYQ